MKKCFFRLSLLLAVNVVLSAGEYVIQYPDLRGQICPIIISGKELLKASDQNLATKSIVVQTKDGRSIPVQIDHRDNSGKYIQPTTQYLCPDDEIVFLTDRESDGTYIIKYGQEGEKHNYHSTIRMELPASFSDLALTNADELQIRIKASRARPDEKKIVLQEDGSGISEQSGSNAVPMEHLLAARMQTQSTSGKASRGDYARGGMEICYKNTMITASGWENLTVPVQPFGRKWDAPAWSAPVVVASGPVRKIVRITYDEDLRGDVIKNGLYLRKGFRGPTHVEHYFTIYARGGVVDYLERVEYSAIDLCALLAYNFQMRVGNIPAKDVQLLIPDDLADGMLRCIEQGKMLGRRDYLENWRILFENPIQQKCLPGYFGWMNPHTKLAVAVFYDVVLNDKETTSLTLNCNTKDLRKGAVETTTVTISKTLFMGEKNAWKPGIYQLRFRFVVDDEGDVGKFTKLYNHWNKSTAVP